MAIEVKATCDAYGCSNEIDLPVEVDGMMNSEIAYLFQEKGWIKDTDSNFCYCNKCFPKVKAELGL